MRGESVGGRGAVLASFLLSILLFAAAEGIMRIADLPRVRPDMLITELDPTLLFRNRRGLSIRTFNKNVPVTINRSGFRGPDVSRGKPAGTYRIVALGDSSTFGYGVADDETFCSRLGPLLNGDSKLAGRKYEVINAGVIGYTSLQGLRLLRDRILGLNPDCLVVSYAINDATMSWAWHYFPGKRLSEVPELSRRAVWLRNFLFNNSRVCRWALVRVLLTRRAFLDELCGDKILGDKLRRVPPDEYRENLAEIARVARAAGIAVVYLPMPVKIRSTIYPDYEPDTTVRDRASSLLAVRSVEKKIRDTRDRKDLCMMYYYLGGLYAGQGKLRNALDAYMTAILYSDPRQEYREQNLEYAELMVAVAQREKVPLRNVLPTFCLRELTDNPSDLYVDNYHPGPLGHRIIAAELHGMIGDLVRAKNTPRKRR
jgi:lysophospholipase L1-like esterase